MRRYLKIFLLPIVVMLIFVGCVLGLKFIQGSSIMHYKQYMYQCQGQITQPMSGIPFYFIDEEKISEMANVDNIKNVYITTDSGKQIDATDWTLEELRLAFAPEDYVKRELKLWLPYEEEYTIKELTIEYPDANETFEVGTLKVIPIKKDAFLRMSVNGSMKRLKKNEKSWTDPDYEPEPSPEPFSTESLQPMQVNFFSAVGQFYSSGGPFTITKIDFGIKGIGIDPSTIRFLQGDESGPIGEQTAFAQKEENKIYLMNDILQELPLQDISISVTESKFSLYASVRMTEEYDSKWTCLYIAPVYYCIDSITGEEFLYGNELNYQVLQPLPLYEEEYEYILNEKGI